MSEDFQRGKAGQPYMGGDYNAWQDGRRLHNPDGGGGGAGGGMCLLIALGLALSFVLIYPALIALIGATVLYIYFSAKGLPNDFKKIYLSVFWAMLAYLLVSFAFCFLIFYLGSEGVIEGFKLTVAAVVMQVVCFLLTALVAKSNLDAYTNFRFGFAQSLVFTLTVLLPATMLVGWLAVRLATNFGWIDSATLSV